MAEAFTPGQTDYIDALNTMNDTFVAADITVLTGTSTTSLLIEVASKTFTTQVDKNFSAGDWLLITSDADPSNYFHGQVTSYSTTTLVIDVDNVGGSGTFADWTITMSGTRGAPGADLDWTVDQGVTDIHEGNVPINVVNDPSPQLSASLDGQSNQINNISLAIAAKDVVTLDQAQAIALSF